VSVSVSISLSARDKALLWRHLLAGTDEHVAFGFATVTQKPTATTFAIGSLLLVTPKELDEEAPYHVSLTDAAQAELIRRAWETKTSLVEFHSHRFRQPAAFSSYDLAGLREFVPHLWWRLRGAPYGAVVVAESSLDALAWITGPAAPEGVDSLVAGSSRDIPTGLSLASLKDV
jgi:hypothetical protein